MPSNSTPSRTRQERNSEHPGLCNGTRPGFLRYRHRSLPQSSSASRFTAGAAGFLNFSQSLHLPLLPSAAGELPRSVLI